jgi:hypothetical protein
LEKNNVSYEKIQEKQKLLEQKEVDYGWLKALNDTANGRTNEKGKVRLETFVQMAYFERILDYANVRLEIMTGGQYTLIRKKTMIYTFARLCFKILIPVRRICLTSTFNNFIFSNIHVLCFNIIPIFF